MFDIPEHCQRGDRVKGAIGFCRKGVIPVTHLWYSFTPEDGFYLRSKIIPTPNLCISSPLVDTANQHPMFRSDVLGKTGGLKNSGNKILLQFVYAPLQIISASQLLLGIECWGLD
jgi:hypothetical protein